MKQSIKRTLLGMLAVPALALAAGAVVPASVYAENPNACDGTGKVTGIKEGKNCAKTADQKGNLGNVIEDITNVLLFIIGAVAVIMIIVGGIRYTLSNGDSAQITSAKNTILYAVIGIVVALLAYAIVNFVVDSFTPGSGEEEGGASRTAS
jgi:ABC-type Fe3+ transport system permease subunit